MDGRARGGGGGTCSISHRLHDCFEFPAIRGHFNVNVANDIPTFAKVGRLLLRKLSTEQEAPLAQRHYVSVPIIDYEILNGNKLLGDCGLRLNDRAIDRQRNIAALFCRYARHASRHRLFAT